jgi:hypothetical protein
MARADDKNITAWPSSCQGAGERHRIAGICSEIAGVEAPLQGRGGNG